MALLENPAVSNAELANISAQMRGWQHHWADLGGCLDGRGMYWQPDAQGHDPHTTEDQAWDMFYHGLGRRVYAALNDVGVYEGEIRSLRLTTTRTTYLRTLDLLANQVKGLYVRYGSNALTNPSAEFGTMTGGTPDRTNWEGGNSYRHVYGDGSSSGGGHPYPDCSFSTIWASKGVRSYYIDSSPCYEEGLVYGGGLKLTSTTAAKPGVKYALRMALNIASLSSGATLRWGVNDGTQELGSGLITSNTGKMIFSASFVSPAAVSGNLNLLCYTFYSTGIFRVDDVRLQEAGTPCETSIFQDAASVALYGRRRVDFTFGAMGDDEAEARTQLKLAEYAWPRTQRVASSGTPGLEIETIGYIDRARWSVSEVADLDDASAHMVALAAECDQVSAGRITTNTLPVSLDDQSSERVYDQIEKVVRAGGSGNTRYSAGVWPGRFLHYYPSDTAPRYLIRGGVVCNLGGQPVEPCLIRPGLARDEDMPVAPWIGRDPALVYLNSVAYDWDSDSVTFELEDEERNRLGTKPAAHDAATAATITGARILT